MKLIVKYRKRKHETSKMSLEDKGENDIKKRHKNNKSENESQTQSEKDKAENESQVSILKHFKQNHRRRKLEGNEMRLTDAGVKIIKTETGKVTTWKNLIERNLKRLNYSIEKMECLNEGQWFDDPAIDLAQNMLETQYPECDGLQSTLVLETGLVYSASCSKHVQIYIALADY